jgi:hypothetical protein
MMVIHESMELFNQFSAIAYIAVLRLILVVVVVKNLLILPSQGVLGDSNLAIRISTIASSASQ